MNPTQDPQQPQNIPPAPTPAPVPVQPQFGVPASPVQPPTPQPVQPLQPFSAPAAPVSPFAAANPVGPAAPSTGGYGAGTMGSQPEVAAPVAYAAAKKGINKKLIIIIAAAVVVLAIIAVILFVVLKPGATTASNGGVVGAIKSAVAPASQLTDHTGTSFSISYPKSFKTEDTAALAASAPGSEVAGFSTDGQKPANNNESVIAVVATPYTASFTRAEALSEFASSTTTAYPDNATSKDTSFAQSTYQGFESITGKSTQLNNGAKVAQTTTEYVFGNKNMYILTMNVTTADTATIGAETNAILASFKINES